ncbi:signal transduction histidine kinase [Promicromonospora sp. AC04]|uniref:sensor histidine kinase n=1 Tax=Promicromonospora sp. AC04 TaxID=2135723 RepID=UPI000D3D9B4B|nr:histidine kinase [Promicromonospora sp. AC04]PUB26151.1 signal transduction histidine kinase [Promicromonospora sp. AC04]
MDYPRDAPHVAGPLAAAPSPGTRFWRLRSLTRLDLTAVSIARREVVWMWTVVSIAAVALVAIGWPLTASGYGTHPAAAMAFTLVHCAAPILAVRWPWAGLGASVPAALALMVVTADATPVWPWPWPVTVLLAHCLTVFVLALRHPWYWAASLWSAGAMLTVLAPAAIVDDAGEAAVANGVVLVSLSGGIALVGVLVRLWILSMIRMEQAERLSAAEAGRRRELEERNRIARELHDVVAHSMSVITVQASTARYRQPGLDEAAQQEFEEIAASSRRALGEMRGLLGILRGQDTAPTAPLPGLPDVAGLIDSTRASGVEITYAGTDAVVPDAVGLTGFRVVQEALSNALRHAPGSSIAVTVAITDDGHDLRVRVTNSAPARSDEPTPGAQLGLAGIRERAAAFGGKVAAGPTPDGGFQLTATLPVVVLDDDPLLT